MTDNEAINMVDKAIKSDFIRKCNVGYDLAEALGIVVRIATNAIKNSNSYNSQGDLIRRSALKEAIKDHFDNLDAYFPYTFIKEVDNAPTVEPFEPDYVGAERLKARQRGYEQGYHFGMEIGKTLNPKIKQGTWKLDNIGVYCSECEMHPDYSSNFCPNCGADMRGGKEE